MKTRTKALVGFVLFLTLFTVASITSYLRIRNSQGQLALVTDLYIPLTRHIAQIQSHISGYADESRRALMGENNTALTREFYPYLIQKKFSLIEELISRFGNEGLAKQIQQSKSLVEKWSQTSDRLKFDQTFSEVRTNLTQIARQLENECLLITAAVRREASEGTAIILILSCLLALFTVTVVILAHKALMPLPQLIDSVKRIADGDFHQSLKVQPSDTEEVASLAREYNRMLEALRERDKKISHQQQELLQSERLAAVGQLSAEIVHEIRNPLNSISLNIDWLQAELSQTGEEVQKTLISISKEVTRLHQITESYLVRAKIPSQESPRTEIHELIEEILEFCAEEDRAKNISLDVQFSSDPIYVKLDRSRLKQAFLNVLRNAREAMPRGGKLSIRTEVIDNLSRIRIADSGYGMNEVTRRQAFQPFFTTKADGTGLGLVLTKTIVEEAQGSIVCDSEIGRGTSFTFQFPV